MHLLLKGPPRPSFHRALHGQKWDAVSALSAWYACPLPASSTRRRPINIWVLFMSHNLVKAYALCLCQTRVCICTPCMRDGSSKHSDSCLRIFTLQARLLHTRSTGRLTSRTPLASILSRFSSSLSAACLAFHLSWCVQPPYVHTPCMSIVATAASLLMHCQVSDATIASAAFRPQKGPHAGLRLGEDEHLRPSFMAIDVIILAAVP